MLFVLMFLLVVVTAAAVTVRLLPPTVSVQHEMLVRVRRSFIADEQRELARAEWLANSPMLWGGLSHTDLLAIESVLFAEGAELQAEQALDTYSDEEYTRMMAWVDARRRMVAALLGDEA